MSSFEGQLTGWIYGRDQVQAPARANAIGAPFQPQASATATSSESACDDTICDLVKQYSQPLYRVAFSVTRNSAEAEDAVQETFLRVLKNKDKLPGIRDARVWLVRITWNVVLDRKRRAKVRPETDDIADLTRTLPCSGPGAESSAIASEGYRLILDRIDALPRKEREALLLSAVEELSTSEIASILATSESSVRSRLFRARQALAVLLSAETSTPQPGAKS